jgi:hypothetical protein
VGYKCPKCTFHFRMNLFTQITMGVC